MLDADDLDCAVLQVLDEKRMVAEVAAEYGISNRSLYNCVQWYKKCRSKQDFDLQKQLALQKQIKALQLKLNAMKLEDY